jgi:hypothetical protein
MIIEIRDIFGRPLFKLNALQLKLFMSEFRAARRRTPAKGLKARIAPDCQILIRRSGKKPQLYQVHQRHLLREMKTDRVWPFYFGFLLLQWIDAVLPPRPKVPAGPIPP